MLWRAIRRFVLADVIYFLSGIFMGLSLALLLYFPRHVPVPRFALSASERDSVASSRDHMLNAGDFGRKMNDFVRVLIWVKTSPKTLNTKAAAVKETWGRRVDKLLFISSAPNESFPAIGLKVSEGWDHEIAMTIQGFRYVYQYHLDDADWFMEVDDSTFVIVENLLYFLSEEDPQQPVYYGHRHYPLRDGEGKDCQGGGYLLSKEALKRLGEIAQTKSICNQKGPRGRGPGDEFSKCMDSLGIQQASTTDALGRSRFHCFEPERHLHDPYHDWDNQNFHPDLVKQGMESISEYTITFRGIIANKMYWMYVYIYHLAPYGVLMGPKQLNTASQGHHQYPQ